MISKFIIGKVFISYSWTDKPFVRNLAKKLEKNGFSVWLDEKELLPGDMLSTRLADAINDSRVIIVVVTKNSVNSKWLKYELDLATKMMVEGKIRLIPILKGDVELPNQVKGLVYADFRRKSRTGYEILLKTIEEEIPAAAAETLFRPQIEYLLERIFDRRSSMNISRNSGWVHYNFVEIGNLPGFEDSLVVPYEIFSTYDQLHFGLGRGFVKRTFSVDHENVDEQYFLMIYEKLESERSLATIADRIYIQELDSPWQGLDQFEITVDMSGKKSMKAREMILRKTKKLIVKHALEHPKRING